MRICSECSSRGQEIDGDSITIGLHTDSCTQNPTNHITTARLVRTERSFLVIQNRLGKRLIEIPYEEASLDGEELYKVIAKQVRTNDDLISRAKLLERVEGLESIEDVVVLINPVGLRERYYRASSIHDAIKEVEA